MSEARYNLRKMHEAQDIYYDGITTKHRCTDCWYSQRYMHENGSAYADDNGFKSADTVYPHAVWCPQRGKF